MYRWRAFACLQCNLIIDVYFQSALNDSLAANSHLKDENTLLKAQVSATSLLLPQATPLSQEQPPDDSRYIKSLTLVKALFRTSVSLLLT